MNKEAGELARQLSKIQARLRQELFEELQAQGDSLESVFDPYSYSPLVHELREKYLTRLYLIQGLIQQLAHLSQGRTRHTTRVLSVAAESQQTLVNLVNRKLASLNGAKVLDVKFIPGGRDESWSALITYEANPFVEEADETAAWM
jgi:hypothetical protein